jgi:Ca-activated chloride channel family protein
MRFARQEFLCLFILIFIISSYAFWALRRGLKTRKKWENSKLKDVSQFSSKGRKILVYCLIIITISLAVLALARPQISYEKPMTQHFDIFCLVDISRSMNTRDVYLLNKKVLRLDLVKEELRNFIKNYIGKDKNCMALIIFGPNAIPRSYFTFDARPLLSYVDNLNTKDFPPEGTDIGEAINTGIDMLDTIDNKPEVFGRRKNKRVFILISDGEDLGEVLEQAIAEIREKRIPIYTIGIGSKKGDYIVEEIDEKGKIIYMTDEEDGGQKVFSRLEDETLKKIARLTGGAYVYSKSGEELSRAFKSVLEREAARERKTEKAYSDIYRHVLKCVFVLCLLIIILYI